MSAGISSVIPGQQTRNQYISVLYNSEFVMSNYTPFLDFFCVAGIGKKTFEKYMDLDECTGWRWKQTCGRNSIKVSCVYARIFFSAPNF